MGIFIYLKK